MESLTRLLPQDYDWMKHTIEDTETDVEAFARSIP